ncbi:UDP-N-acetyl glucosamine 2-epimerase [Clostridia bacterium]|nr:UDP-N-acetyl glucosamine 2-epimerase [Clostridia bacterium]
MRKIKVLSVFGTRPEAVKMCPLALELRRRPEIESAVCLTGQHREQLDQVMAIFGVRADYDLNIMRPRQTLTSITVDILEKIGGVLDAAAPDLVLVHGDTTTAFAAALAAFYRKIPVGHVEAGLRSRNIASPYPEEMNRLVADRLSALRFAPTRLNRENLLREGIDGAGIFVTGNTVIDAFRYTLANEKNEKQSEKQRTVLITAHRRENLGKPLENICRALKTLAENHPETAFVYPVHLNPSVRETVFPILEKTDNIQLLDPLDVTEMHRLMARSFLVLTDSGGLQEEAPHFGIPVLVLRSETERPEAVEAGTVKVIGTEYADIVREAEALFDGGAEYAKMARSVNPYGDGHASERIADLVISYANSTILNV